jgi:hypothetical protein
MTAVQNRREVALDDRRTPDAQPVPRAPRAGRYRRIGSRPGTSLGQSRLLALILTNVVEASASSRMAALATSLYRLGVVMVGPSGQRIMITLGLSAGWTKTTSIMSPDWLIWPEASGVTSDIGDLAFS